MSGKAPRYRTTKLAYYRKTDRKMVGDDRVYTEDERAFMAAVEQMKARLGRPGPRADEEDQRRWWAEVLAVARALGYRKVQ